MLRAYFSLLFSLGIVASLCASAIWAQKPLVPHDSSNRSASPESLVVLRNGEVLRGTVTATGDRLVLSLPGRELSLRRSEVDVVARSLDDAYEQKRVKTPPTSVEGRLDLAEWCLQHGLFAGVADELATAHTIQPRHQRLKALDERLQGALATRPNPSKTSAAAPPLAKSKADGDPTVRIWPPSQANRPTTGSARSDVSSSETSTRSAAESAALLDRFMRTLPSTAVEEFTSTLQPMIVHGCATAGCHAPGNDTGFTLLRLPQGKTASRRLTQRNLYNTAQLVDFNEPADSRLLKVAGQPHGPLAAGVFGDRRSPKYKQLTAWIAQLTGAEIKAPQGAADGSIGSLEGDLSEPAAGKRNASPRRARTVDNRRQKSSGAATHDHFPGSVQPAAFESPDSAPRHNQPAEIRQAAAESPLQPNRPAGTSRAVDRGAVTKAPTRGADHAAGEAGKARAKNAWPPRAK